jgi:glutaredoxin
MRKSFRLAAVVSVVVLALTTACSSTKPPQNVSSASASAQARSSAGTPEVALASHLKQIGAKLYGTYWCPYCHKQKALFGNEAFSQLDYVECDPAGKNARPELCQKAHVEGFPTWEIKGKQYGGFRSLQDLANLSGYQGDRNFKN